MGPTTTCLRGVLRVARADPSVQGEIWAGGGPCTHVHQIENNRTHSPSTKAKEGGWTNEHTSPAKSGKPLLKYLYFELIYKFDWNCSFRTVSMALQTTSCGSGGHELTCCCLQDLLQSLLSSLGSPLSLWERQFPQRRKEPLNFLVTN